MKCGLLGEHLGHSYSPQIHRELAEYPYTIFEKQPEELADFLRSGDFTGINVTIPYKKAVIPFLAELSPRAKVLGAVNTVVRRPDGSLVGHNTDFFGFETMLASTGVCVSGKKALVLGSGGASNTVCAVLHEQGANVIVISRSGENNYENLYLHADASVIVNTTPVGMYPNVGISPIDLDLFPRLEAVLDVVYNPARTQILLDAEKRGLKTANGLLMLVAQAKESAEWFSEASIPDEKITAIYHKLRLQMENVVLIGMPGSGKSTVGELLAQFLGKRFVDADAEIVSTTQKTIPEIFSEGGEPAFREIETQVLDNLGKQSGLVIATGGGCVTQSRNYPLLHQNGTIICLERDLSLLPTEGRPLSQAGKLEEMYRIRKPLYERFADFTIGNNGSPQETALRIKHILEEQP